MNDLDKSLSELGALIAKHEEVQNQIFCHYVKIVNVILRNEITSEQVIKKIMDGLFDFSNFGGGRFFRLYRKLCFHVYYYYPPIGKQYRYHHAGGNTKSRVTNERQ